MMTEKSLLEKRRARGQMKPLTAREVSAIETILHAQQAWRDLALFRLGIDTMLRASDLVRLYVDEVTDHNRAPITFGEVMLKKTARFKGRAKFALTPNGREALQLWLNARPAFAGEWLFPGRSPGEHLSATQYRRLAKEWFAACGLDVRQYSTHSLRRTKAAAIYSQTGNIEAVRRLLGHANVKETSTYLGVDDNDALSLSEKIRI